MTRANRLAPLLLGSLVAAGCARGAPSRPEDGAVALADGPPMGSPDALDASWLPDGPIDAIDTCLTMSLGGYLYDEQGGCLEGIATIPACVRGPITKGSAIVCGFSPDGRFHAAGLAPAQTVTAPGWKFLFRSQLLPGVAAAAMDGTPLSERETTLCAALDEAKAVFGCPACPGTGRHCGP